MTPLADRRPVLFALGIAAFVIAFTTDERVFGLVTDGQIMTRTAYAMSALGEIGIARGHPVDIARPAGDAVTRYGMGPSLVRVPITALAGLDGGDAQHGLVGLQVAAPVDVSYLSDTVLLVRYFEAFGQIRRAISVVKKRIGPHEVAVREMRIDAGGIRIGEPLTNFHGVLSGAPQFTGEPGQLGVRD